VAKLNAPKGFDKSRVDGELLKKLEPFIDFCNQNFDQLLSGFAGQITLGDNLAGKIVSISAQHNTPITIQNPGKAVSLILPLFSKGQAIRSIAYNQNSSGSIDLTLRFDGAIPVATKSASAAQGTIVYYECKDPVEPGDLVSVTGYGASYLNGEFLVMGVTDTSPRKILCANVNNGIPASPSTGSEVKTAYSTTETQVNSITLFLGF
jgi:hypothetical protein